jgi:hypothetical protein
VLHPEACRPARLARPSMSPFCVKHSQAPSFLAQRNGYGSDGPFRTPDKTCYLAFVIGRREEADMDVQISASTPDGTGIIETANGELIGAIERGPDGCFMVNPRGRSPLGALDGKQFGSRHDLISAIEAHLGGTCSWAGPKL